MDVEVPQIGVVAEEIEGTILISMMVTTTGSMAKYFLCTAEQNYQHIAKQLHDNICTAGAEARRHSAKSKILVVKDLPDSLKNGGRH